MCWRSGGGVLSEASSRSARQHIGNEFDLVAEYEVNTGLSFGFGYTRTFTG